MLSYSFLFLLAGIGALIGFWWRSDRVKHLALREVARYCQQQELQLLDQSLVLRGLWPVRQEGGGLSLRRRYGFEFSTTGSARYQGRITMVGARSTQIRVDAHIIPRAPERLH